jgi:5-(carboxyamino)imidazole ribonucleotide synthase
MKRVGIIGGGQLAGMMAQAAAALELEIHIQTPAATDTAVSLVQHTVLAAIDDAAATAQLGQGCDWITFENEFVDLAALGKLPDICFRPPLAALAPLLDKYDQRQYLQKLGLPVPRFCAGTNYQAADWEFPIVVKARRHGYDGQGTHIVKDAATLATLPLDQMLIEEFVPFSCELAVIAARSVTGQVVVYPVVETQQVEQVCRRVYTTVAVSDELRQEIDRMAHQILHSLGTIGVMGIELFLTAAGRVLINELAPRTHNSGHFTIEACATSQFTQHLRAVAGLSLGDSQLICPGAVMVNLLGYEAATSDYLEQRQKIAALPHTYVHWYDKPQARPGRKLGHVTVLLSQDQRELAMATAQQIEDLWYPQHV